jgi:hypothetical protein
MTSDSAPLEGDQEFADATEQDDLIEQTDNSGDPGTEEVSQDPNWVPESDTDEPAEVAE